MAKKCTACNGTGTYGVGGPGAWSSSKCSKCNGTGTVGRVSFRGAPRAS